jgi:hypothetical protein
VLIGFFLLILGTKLLKATTIVVSIISVVTVSLVIFYNFFQVYTLSSVWIVLSVGFILGLLLGYLMIKLTNWFFAMMGGYLGYVIGIFIYNLLLKFVEYDAKVLYWITLLGSIFLFAMLALWIIKHILILGTSICGAYAVIRGASLYIGEFPDEDIILDLLKHQEFSQLEQVRI